MNLINGSTADSFLHEICCIKTSGRSSKRLIGKIPIHEMHKGDGNDLRIIGKIVKLIRMVNPDVVHTRNWGTTDAIVAARIAGVGRIIHGEHGWNMDDPKGEVLRRRVARTLLSPLITNFVTVSDDLRRWLHEKARIKLSKISKISNGVDTDKFRPRNMREAKNRIGLENQTVLGIVSRLDPIKRHDLLFRAFEAIQVRCPATKLVVVGDGPERANLERILSRMLDPSSVIFLGEREDVAEVYPAMDVFVLPSENEGISNTILEAMATGKPIIATAVGGNLEVVTHRRTGLLIPEHNIGALSDAMTYYIGHPEERKTHGRNARVDASSRFSLKRMVKEYENLYTKILA